MKVVWHAAHGKGKHLFVFADASDIGPESGLKLFRDELQTAFGTKDEMDMVLRVAVGHARYRITRSIGKYVACGFDFMFCVATYGAPRFVYANPGLTRLG